MTTKELCRIWKLRADRAKLHEQRAELRSTARRLSCPPMDGMPRGCGGVNRAVEKNAVKLADLEAKIQEKNLAILREENKIQQFISSVPDARLRLIIRYRIIDELSWEKVAQAIGWRVETPAGVKATFLRFMREQGQNPT